MGRVDPAVGRGRLRALLRRSREDAGLSRQAVANDLGWSHSKIARIESGRVGVSQTDVLALLRRYGLDDAGDVAREAVELARASRYQDWGGFRDVLNADYVAYLGYEAVSTKLQEFQLIAVPSVLQSPSYAAALVESLSQNVDATVRERRVEARLARQEILDRSPRPTMSFVLGEAALRSWVGAPDNREANRETMRETMRGQLNHLIALDDRSDVEIRVLPFTFGSHWGLAGGFTLLELDGEPGHVLHRDFARPGLVIDDMTTIQPFIDLFDEIYKAGRPFGTMVGSLLGALDLDD